MFPNVRTIRSPSGCYLQGYTRAQVLSDPDYTAGLSSGSIYYKPSMAGSPNIKVGVLLVVSSSR